MTDIARYLKFSLNIMATFLLWLMLGSILSMLAPLLGTTSSNIFELVVNSTTSVTFLVAFVVFYFHRRIFKRDVFEKSDTGHLMVLASTAFLPIFIYLTCASLIRQLISARFLSPAMLGDTLRHNFMVVVPVYFITLVAAGIAFSLVYYFAKKFIKRP